MRSIVYTNPNGVSITLGNGSANYGITSIEGLGVPDVMLQSQRAPYQHGSTYIDQLLEDREITVNGIIAVGADPEASYPLRHDLVAVINPILGQGVITYTNDHVIRKATCTAVGPVFANNNANEGSQRFMVTFHCHDPFLYFDAASTINLPTSVNGAEVVINSGTSNYPSVTQKADGNLFIAYIRESDGYLVSREYATSWGAESVINAAISATPSVMQKSNGNLFVAYRRVSDGYLVSREYATSWGAEVVINAAESEIPSVIQKANGNIFIVYIRVIGGYLVSREYATSWGAEVVINAADCYAPSIIQKSNGNLFVAYRRVSDGYLVSREYATSWGAEVVINAANSDFPSVIQKSNGNLFIVYLRGSDLYLVSREYITSWGIESIKAPPSRFQPSVIQKSNGDIFIVYRNQYAYIACITRSVTPVNASNTGQYKTPVVTRLNGPSVNPRFVNAVTLLFMQLNITLLTGDYFIIDTTFGKKSVSLMKDGILQNGIQYMASGSTFFDLAIGDNTIYYEDDAYASSATATMTWTNRDVGV